MGRMSQHSTWVILVSLPLRQEIVTAVITNLVNQLTMGVTYFVDMRGKNNTPPAISDDGFQFVHAFGCCPQVIIHLRHDGQHPLEGLLFINDPPHTR